MRRIPLLLAVACLAACGDDAPAAAPYPPGASSFSASSFSASSFSASSFSASSFSASSFSASSFSAAAGDCGSFDLHQGEEVPGDAVTCLLDAFTAKRVATLKVTSPTTEGDPIPVTYATRADGRIDVTTDSRQDNFGTQIIERVTCSAAVYSEAEGVAVSECGEPLRVEE
ncbi:DUF4362 domain-containing protein [Actinoplanes sp. CA-015351]|uniref:DUF4362 domain-containing protein n=1 Tax=Actinoplanes sp. CA-015351 TaxID=3239897 RepID=UPI003D9850D5